MNDTLFTIRGGGLTAIISTKGAEIQSLRSDDGKEYNWQGTPPYWQGRGPILFPATGAPWNEIYFYNGKSYYMPKHGFVKEQNFSVTSHSENELVLEYCPNEETQTFYPFDYLVRIIFTISAGLLRAVFEVENKAQSTLFFQMGGHPALVVPDFDKDRAVNGYVRLKSSKETSELSVVRAREQGCIQPGRFSVPKAENGLVPLCVDTFANEALIFDNHQVQAIELLDLKENLVASVQSDAPCWLIWQMQGVNSPFVCFEPWYGLPDNEGESRELKDRPYVQQVAGGSTWKGGFTIKVF